MNSLIIVDDVIFDDPKVLLALTLTRKFSSEEDGEKEVEQRPALQLLELTTFSSTLFPELFSRTTV